jgi:hypothetical protein
MGGGLGTPVEKSRAAEGGMGGAGGTRAALPVEMAGAAAPEAFSVPRAAGGLLVLL